MKPKLLITLGCSYTEGVGCYDNDEVKRLYSLGVNPKNDVNFYFNSRKRFHEYGWPVNLQKLLKYDKLINLGMGGSANSHHLKRFTEEFAEVNLSLEYDVLIIWFMTFPGRISFYSDGKIQSLVTHTHEKEDIKTKMLREGYYGFIKDDIFDPTLEQLFYLKTLKTICDGFGYNFLYANADYVTNLLLNDLYPSSLNLNNGLTELGNRSFLEHISDPVYHSLLRCHHPNELGYKVMAEKMFAIIQTHHPHLINKTTPTLYDFEYRDSKQWVKK